MSKELIELINSLLYGYITPEIYDREYEKLLKEGKP